MNGPLSNHHSPKRIIQALALGAGWFPDHPGGLERVYHALWRHLPDVNVEVEGLVVGSDRVDATSNGTVDAFAPPSAPLLQRWRSLRHAVKAHIAGSTPDLVAAHFALYTFPILDVIRSYPFVYHFHGPWAWEGQKEEKKGPLVHVKAWLERTVYNRADRLIVLSEAFRNVLLERYGVPEHRIRVVPGGVDVDRFDLDISQQQAQEHLGWPTDRSIILSVRRLARRMGLENLIDAMETVRRQIPDVLLLIAGKGPLADALQNQITDRGLTSHVRLLGFVPDDDLPLAYRAADFSIVPTLALEGFGLITIESLAAGTPVFVTPVGGLPETVEGLDPRLVLDAPTSGALARGVVDALRGHRPLPDASACTLYARAHFDWPVIAQQVRTVYEEVL